MNTCFRHARKGNNSSFECYLFYLEQKSENFMNQEILYFHTLKKFLFCTFHFLLIKVSEKSNELRGTEFSHIDHLYSKTRL